MKTLDWEISWFRPTTGLAVAICLVTASAAAESRYIVEKAELADATSLIVLRDNVSGVEAAVAPSHGGELAGLRVRFRGEWIELLRHARQYSAGSKWGDRAPILWPAVGRHATRDDPADRNAVNDSYDYEGRRYEMPIHGFARIKAWQVLAFRADESQAVVEVGLVDDATTRTHYPFGFELRVVYCLSAGRLEIRHKVRAAATNRGPMPFSIGNHIGFQVPFVAGSALAGFTLETPSRIEILRDANSIPTGETRLRDFSRPTPIAGLKMVPAISLGGYAGDPWVRLSDPSGLSLRLFHRAQSNPSGLLVQFNLWGVPAEGYFCPEPWLGLQNSLNRGEGLMQLAPGEDWSWLIGIEPEQAVVKSQSGT